MHAEAERPVVLILSRQRGRGTVRCYRSSARDEGKCGCLQLRVHHVQTHVEVLGHIPLGPRTYPESLPIIVATVCYRPVGAEAAKDRIGLVVVANLGIATIDRCTPARV